MTSEERRRKDREYSITRDQEKRKRRQKEYHNQNKESMKAYQKKYKILHSEELKRKEKERQAKDPGKWRRDRTRRYYKSKYGCSIEGFNALKEAQGGMCMICSAADDLCLDHNHQTGKIRGILCRQCNAQMGSFGDDLAGLQCAIVEGTLSKYIRDNVNEVVAYLEKSG